jgi:alpha-L-fucosidase
MPDGRIEPRQVERLKMMGDWLKQYGDSIYGTRGGPFQPRFEIASTHKNNRVFLHIFDWPEDVLQLPTIPYKIVDSKNRVGDEVTVQQRDDYTWISVPSSDRHPIDTLIELELDRPVEI